MSSPSNRISPAVGSISRLRWRTRVDLPEPESPITTKHLPASMVSETSRTPIVWPVCASSASFDHAGAQLIEQARGRRAENLR